MGRKSRRSAAHDRKKARKKKEKIREKELANGCVKKTRYETVFGARAAIAMHKRDQEHYHCRHCGGWHITDG